MLKVACGLEPHGLESKVLGMYKEVQIHGPIEFGKHVECAMIDPVEAKGCEKVIEQFREKFRVNVIMIEK